MYLRILSGAVLAFVACTSLAAGEPATATAITTQSVNVRAGPVKDFPPVTWLLSGKTVTVVGCVESWRWCDVIYGRDRGWVYARHLALNVDGRKMSILQGGPATGLPVIPFEVGPYWQAHYTGRTFMSRQLYWQTRWDRRVPAPEWRARP